jgi:23S rRNA pseudouridine1911/1915/1917 synthase
MGKLEVAGALKETTGETLRRLTVGPAEAGERLDRFLARRLPELSRARLQNLIRSGHVGHRGEAIAVAARRVKPGEIYEVRLPAPAPAAVEAQAMPLAIVYEDRHLLVIDKPKGLVVHPGAGHASGTLVNALLAHCGESLSGIGGVKRPGIVHRLDKDTTGLLVVAKTEEAHQGLTSQFAAKGAGGLERRYLGLVWGVPERPRGVIDAPLARAAADRTRMAVVRGERGRRAVTRYEVLETFSGIKAAPAASLLGLSLETGRTHQIRAHLAHIGHPLLGDPTYGAGFKASARTLTPQAQAALAALGRQALHAAELSFTHPVTAKKLHFQSALPNDMTKLVAALRQG